MAPPNLKGQNICKPIWMDKSFPFFCGFGKVWQLIPKSPNDMKLNKGFTNLLIKLQKVSQTAISSQQD
jgi:hypothetical protein